MTSCWTPVAAKPSSTGSWLTNSVFRSWARRPSSAYLPPPGVGSPCELALRRWGHGSRRRNLQRRSSGNRAPARCAACCGEDFLRNFDVLIDYRHRSLRLEAPLGSMAQTAMGEHLPLQLTGIYHGKPTRNRLIISGVCGNSATQRCRCFWTPAQTSLPSSRTTLVPGKARTYQ